MPRIIIPSSSYTEIDSTNPLNKGLVVWYPCLQNGGLKNVMKTGNYDGSQQKESPTWTTCPKNSSWALNFNGTSQSVKGFIGSILSDSVTVCAWIRTTSSVDQFISSFYQGVGGDFKVANWSAGGVGQLEIHDATDGILKATSRVINLHTWYHVGYTLYRIWDNDTQWGADVRFFINGKLEENTTSGLPFSPAPTGNPLTYAIASSNDSDWFEGDMSDIRIYNRPLEEQEINKIYRSSPIRDSGQFKRSSSIAATPTMLERIRSRSKPVAAKTITIKHNETPSYKAGYAKSASESAHPELWDGLEGAWIPSLGNSGDVLRNAARSGVSDGAFESWDDSTTEWGVDRLTFSPATNKSYINCGVFDKLDGSFSVTTWFKPAADNRVRGLMGSGDSAWSASWSITYHGPQEKIYCLFNDNVTSALFASTSPILGGADVDWVHIAVRKTKGVGYELFINGRSEATGTDNGSMNTGYELWIGRLEEDGNTNTVNTFGDVGSTLIYSRALSNDEISLLASDGPAPFRKKTLTIGCQPTKDLRGLIRVS